MIDRLARNIAVRVVTNAIAAAALLSCIAAPGRFSVASELRQTAIVKAIQAARPAIVNIRGEKVVAAVAGQPTSGEAGRRVNGMGTGVIIDPRGYIVTNYHVVDGVHEIHAALADGAKYTARLIARDLDTDLALIKIDPDARLTPIAIGTSSDLMPGESVIAVGNAYGYENTVTRGIVSALHRAVQVSDAQFYDDLIQTDASINPGNSGGPLLNVDGEMIGINVAVRAGAQGIGFAIPVDKVVKVVADLISSYNAKKFTHGVELTANNGPNADGLVVAAVAPGSPAAEAGLQPGDVVKAAGDVAVHRALDFQRAVLELKPGQQLELTVHRKTNKEQHPAGEDVAVNVTLSDAAQDSKAVAATAAWNILGLELKPMATQDFRQAYQTRYRGGLSVTGVRPDSPAANQGIRRGDVLVGMHIWETVSLENVNYVLNRPDFDAANPVKFYILRGNETLYGYIAVAAAKSPKLE